MTNSQVETQLDSSSEFSIKTQGFKASQSPYRPLASRADYEKHKPSFATFTGIGVQTCDRTFEAELSETTD
ncbi:hypothetical protein TNIN_83121 [Trichonephila inaurata madagascariensis]|uniref:Uncharacterized protein n=1 Tax=Trichonephila inaurata madagascariensis TaxID=2747483 RepID=A0A8X6X2I1_9ARAC|nr:hypothetical protein TNIN_83121 [Trichonephila inaurata madagascariensis]